MLNTMWPTQEEISIKEELKDDVLSNPGSPFQSSSLGHTPSSPYRSISVSEYHRLSPPESSNHYYFGTDADSNHLQTLLPLPPFPNFQPESPSKTSVSLDVPTISISEISSSDSSQWLSLASQNVDSSQDVIHSGSNGSRKRSNSGSSGSSANSGSCGSGNGQSRSKIRRRQPASQEELHHQRNQANKRERDRTQSLNDAFTKLRDIVPTQPSDKLSKRETLKLAQMYINFLNMVLESQNKYENPIDVFAREKKDLIEAFNVWRMGQHAK